MKDFLELAKARYSVRKFDGSKPIEDEKMALILEAAKVAPSACNAQAVKLYIISSKEGMEKANKLTPCVFGANTLLMFCYDADKEWRSKTEENFHSGDEDASILATHVMFEAFELGLGTCYVNMFSRKAASELFDLPSNIVPVLVMPIGYEEEGSKPAPLHTMYSNWDNVVEKK